MHDPPGASSHGSQAPPPLPQGILRQPCRLH
jgi:hypothetical protein